MKKFIINQNMLMSDDDIKAYEALPINLPETSLNQKQKDLVSDLYYRYITKIDNRDWSKPMYKGEMSEKWPSGNRMKEHEAKRIILNNLVELQDKKDYTVMELASLFHTAITCRPMYGKLIANFFILTNED